MATTDLQIPRHYSNAQFGLENNNAKVQKDRHNVGELATRFKAHITNRNKSKLRKNFACLTIIIEDPISTPLQQ